MKHFGKMRILDWENMFYRTRLKKISNQERTYSAILKKVIEIYMDSKNKHRNFKHF